MEDHPKIYATIAELARDLGWEAMGVAYGQADDFELEGAAAAGGRARYEYEPDHYIDIHGNR